MPKVLKIILFSSLAAIAAWQLLPTHEAGEKLSNTAAAISPESTNTAQTAAIRQTPIAGSADTRPEAKQPALALPAAKVNKAEEPVSLSAQIHAMRQTSQLPAKTLESLLFIEQNFETELAALLVDKSADSIEVEQQLPENFASWQQQQPEFNQLTLDTVQCNRDICVVSINGLAALDQGGRERLERAILSEHKATLLPKKSTASAGVFSEIVNSHGHFFRVAYPINPRFSHQPLQG